jgi:hypothetical protein
LETLTTLCSKKLALVESLMRVAGFLFPFFQLLFFLPLFRAPTYFSVNDSANISVIVQVVGNSTVLVKEGGHVIASGLPNLGQPTGLCQRDGLDTHFFTIVNSGNGSVALKAGVVDGEVTEQGKFALPMSISRGEFLYNSLGSGYLVTGKTIFPVDLLHFQPVPDAAYTTDTEIVGATVDYLHGWRNSTDVVIWISTGPDVLTALNATANGSVPNPLVKIRSQSIGFEFDSFSVDSGDIYLLNATHLSHFEIDDEGFGLTFKQSIQLPSSVKAVDVAPLLFATGIGIISTSGGVVPSNVYVVDYSLSSIEQKASLGYVFPKAQMSRDQSTAYLSVNAGSTNIAYLMSI